MLSSQVCGAAGVRNAANADGDPGGRQEGPIHYFKAYYSPFENHLGNFFQTYISRSYPPRVFIQKESDVSLE